MSIVCAKKDFNARLKKEISDIALGQVADYFLNVCYGITDYCAENDWSDQSRVIAQVLKDKLHTAYPESNLWYYEDKWDESFIVTKFNTMPSVLLETGYYTNEEDVRTFARHGAAARYLPPTCAKCFIHFALGN